MTVRVADMPDRTTLVAVYGTCRRGFHNHRFVEERVPHGAATLTGYVLHLAPPGALPMIVPSDEAGARVAVELYALDAEQLARLDRLEGHPTWYRRTPVSVVRADGLAAVAETYVIVSLPAGAVRVRSGDYREVGQREG